MNNVDGEGLRIVTRCVDAQRGKLAAPAQSPFQSLGSLAYYPSFDLAACLQTSERTDPPYMFLLHLLTLSLCEYA